MNDYTVNTVDPADALKKGLKLAAVLPGLAFVSYFLDKNLALAMVYAAALMFTMLFNAYVLIRQKDAAKHNGCETQFDLIANEQKYIGWMAFGLAVPCVLGGFWYGFGSSWNRWAITLIGMGVAIQVTSTLWRTWAFFNLQNSFKSGNKILLSLFSFIGSLVGDGLLIVGILYCLFIL